MLGNLSGWHLLAVVFIVLLLFGAPKLPALARSLGQSMKIFRSEVKSDKSKSGDADVSSDDQTLRNEATGAADSPSNAVPASQDPAPQNPDPNPKQ